MHKFKVLTLAVLISMSATSFAANEEEEEIPDLKKADACFRIVDEGIKLSSELGVEQKPLKQKEESLAVWKRKIDKETKAVDDEPGAVFRIMYTGLIYECIDVIADENGNVSSVTAKIVTDKKPRVAIHGLSSNSAIAVEIYEPSVIPSEDVEPSDYLKIKKGYCESIALETEGTFQAVRYGWVVKDRNKPERLILTTSLRSGI